MATSFGQHFQNAFGDDNKTGYIRTHYDAMGYCSTGQSKIPGNNIASIRNTLVEAINKETVLPKAIILVIENDLLDSFIHYNPGVSLLSGICIEWLANQMHRIIVTHKEQSPSKSCKFKYPTILWLELPSHFDWSNSKREARGKFNNCIKSTVSLFREMEMLRLSTVWDDCDRGLITKGKMNARGLTIFWLAVDLAFQAWDKEQFAKTASSAPSISGCGGKKKKTNNYREHVTNLGKFNWKAQNTKFMLPKPSARQ